MKINAYSKKPQDVKNLPKNLVFKLESWIDEVMEEGLRYVRLLKGYHDEPLKGKRKGQRSIRLNRAYRAIYIIKKDGAIEFVEMQEVNKHEY